MPDWIFKNKPTAYATLASPSGTSGTTLTLTTGHGTRLPAPGAGQISAVRIENELITYTGNSGDVLTGVTRGAGATNHVAGTEVKNVLVEEWANAVTALSTDTKAALAGTSGTPQATNKFVTDADPRNSDARNPNSHSHVEGDTTGLVADLAARVLSTDSRLSDARTPTAHAISHKATGGDVLAGVVGGYAPLDSGLLVPVANLGTGTPTGLKFLRDDRVWAVPAGGGGGGFANPMTMEGDLIVGGAGGGIDTSTDYLNPPTGVTGSDSVGQGFASGTGLGKACDGNTSTFWQSSGVNASAGPWLKWDLGTARQLAGFKVLGFNGLISNYATPIRVEYSADDITYTSLGNFTFIDNTTIALGSAPTGRYWKFTAVGGDSGNTWAIKEFSLYALSGTAPGIPERLPSGQTLTDAATITWNVAAGHHAQVTLGGNRTLAAPTNLVAGQVYTLHVVQDSAGSRTLTWNSTFKWPSGTTPTLSTGVGKRDVFMFSTDGTHLYATAQAIDVR